MPAAAVEGLADVQRGLKTVDRDVRLGFRKQIRQAAEVVRADAEDLADTRIRNIGPQWGRMRVGVTRTAVYVAPRKRAGRNPALKRPNLADLLMNRAMQPALEHHQEQAVREIEQVVEQACRRFNRTV